MPPLSLIPDRCPECDSEGSVTIDEDAGMVVCTECGVVLRMGLEESSDTAFYDDQVKSENTTRRLRGGAGDGAMGALLDHIRSLRARFDAPEAVGAEAAALANDYDAKLGDQSGSVRPQAVPLAIALFHIASRRQHFPVSLAQAAEELRSKHPTRDLVGSIVATLQLELPSLQRTLEDHVRILLDKIDHRPLEPMCTLASALAGLFAERVTSSYESRVVAACSIFAAMTALKMSQKLLPRVAAALSSSTTTATSATATSATAGLPASWTPEELKSLMERLGTLIGARTDLVSAINFLKANAKSKAAWFAAAEEKFPEVPAAADVAGLRRERDADGDGPAKPKQPK